MLDNYADQKRCERLLPGKLPRPIRSVFAFAHTDRPVLQTASQTNEIGGQAAVLLPAASAVARLRSGHANRSYALGLPRGGEPLRSEKSRSSPQHLFNFVEACCAPDSILSSPAFLASAFRCTRIGVEEDFASQFGMDLALRQLRGPGDVLWISTPCTGGSPFQKIARRRASPSGTARMRALQVQHDRLWNAVEHVASVARCRGCTVIVEWPTSCAYWNEPRVLAFLDRCRFKNAYIDGCMVGLTSPRYGREGRLLHKRWRLAVSHSMLVPLLTYVCQGRSLNGCISVEGADTKRTESYSNDFATLVLHALLAQRRGSV